MVSSQVGGPLIVNGVEIAPEEIALYLIYGPARAELDYQRIECWIEWGIEIRRLKGLRGEVDITPARLQWELTERAGDFEKKFPTLDEDVELRRANRSRAWWERTVAQQLRYDQVFLPDDPDLWLPCSLEAMRQEAGNVLIDDFRESYERRRQQGPPSSEFQGMDGAPSIPSDDRTYRRILRRIVDESLNGAFAPRTALDGLPNELALALDVDGDSVDDLVLTTHQLWNAIQPVIDPEELAEARRFLALLEATRQRLGVSIPSVEQARERARTTGGRSMMWSGYKGSHAFPSMESFWQYARLKYAYEDMFANDLWASPEGELSPRLSAHFNRANQIMGLARVECEVLLVSAFDFETFRWNPHGWREAMRRAERLRHEANVSPARWERLLDVENDFWDPPLPVRHGCTNGRQTRTGGRFYLRSRSDLRPQLYENTFTEFLTGDSVTDRIFFDAPTGEIVGPFKGQWGYYLARVTDRKKTLRPLNLQDPKHVELLTADYVRHSFVAFAHEALATSSVTGL